MKEPISLFALAMQDQRRTPNKPKRSRLTVDKTEEMKKIAKRKIIYIIIKNNCAFIPHIAFVSDWNKFVMTAPIMEFPLSSSSLTPIVDKFLHQQVPVISHEEGMQVNMMSDLNRHPLQLATGSKNWEELYLSTAIYSIGTIENESLGIIGNVHQNRWVLAFPKPTKNLYPSLEFPTSTPIEELIWVILEDCKKHNCTFRTTGT